jgi:putative restriction endonuclease
LLGASFLAVPSLSQYVDLSAADARLQWRRILNRLPRPETPGFRQEPFLPIETLLCLSASLSVNHHRYGGGSSGSAPSPVPELSTLFERTPASILAKMANLDGSRTHGAVHEVEASALLLNDMARLVVLYLMIIDTGRMLGVGEDRLPDFLLSGSATLELIGQEELANADVERTLEETIQAFHSGWAELPESVTERLLIGAARVGQHRFSSGVLVNFGHRCAFCGLTPGVLEKRRLLVASHIKPWKDSSSSERLDVRNGLAACPTHDAAFDSGLVYVNGGLRIHPSPGLRRASTQDHGMAREFGPTGLKERLVLPEGAVAPLPRYLEWHKQHVYAS